MQHQSARRHVVWHRLSFDDAALRYVVRGASTMASYAREAKNLTMIREADHNVEIKPRDLATALSG
jgi:hypothetical protein